MKKPAWVLVMEVFDDNGGLTFKGNIVPLRDTPATIVDNVEASTKALLSEIASMAADDYVILHKRDKFNGVMRKVVKMIDDVVPVRMRKGEAND